MTLHNEQDAIKQAAPYLWGDWKVSIGKRSVKVESNESIYAKLWPIPELLQTPRFWQALGKARGWGKDFDLWMRHGNPSSTAGHDENYYTANVPEWKYHALRYFETLLSGGSLEEYWRNLP